MRLKLTSTPNGRTPNSFFMEPFDVVDPRNCGDGGTLRPGLIEVAGLFPFLATISDEQNGAC